MNLTIGTVRTPSADILCQIYGEGAPIDQYVNELKEEALKSSVTLDDAIKAVMNYAEGLNREQRDYDMISPYGGLDVTIQSVDEIALSQEDILKERFPDEDVLLKIADALKKKGYALHSVERFCKMYDKTAALEEEILKAWHDHQEAKKREAQRQQRAETEYTRCQQALDKEIEMLETALSNPLLLLFRRRKEQQQNKLNEILTLKETLQSGAVLQPVDDCFISCFFPWEKYDDFDELTELHTKEDMEEAVSCIRNYISENKTNYEKAQKLLSLN